MTGRPVGKSRRTVGSTVNRTLGHQELQRFDIQFTGVFNEHQVGFGWTTIEYRKVLRSGDTVNPEAPSRGASILLITWTRPLRNSWKRISKIPGATQCR